MKHVLITGATGFLGSHLVRRLCSEGYPIIILKRSFSNCWRIADLMPGLTAYDTDRIDLSVPFQRHSIDAVIHTSTSYGRRHHDFSNLVEANVTFPLRLLEEAAASHVGTFMNTDTFSGSQLMKSAHLFGYHLTKKHFIDWGRFIADNKPIRFTNVKLEHLYGPLDSDHKFTKHIMQSCVKRLPELLLTPGEQKRDFIYVDDAVSAYRTLLKQSDQMADGFMEYELGSGEAITIRSFVELVRAITKSSTELRFGALPYRVNEMMNSQADIRPLRSLGWTNKITLSAGIQAILDEEASNWSSED